MDKMVATHVLLIVTSIAFGAAVAWYFCRVRCTKQDPADTPSASPGPDLPGDLDGPQPPTKRYF
jgi:hypothetical protein